MISLKAVAAVMVGGALGSLARYAATLAAFPISGRIPWGTILINAAGSFLIGLFAHLTTPGGRYPAGELARTFVMIGVLGGFTTFSSFSLQTLELMRAGAGGRALVNVLASLALCFAAVAAGNLTAGLLNGPADAPAPPGGPRGG